jgi:hypothetical protein
MAILDWEAAVLRARQYYNSCSTSPVYDGDHEIWFRALEDARSQLDAAEIGLRRAKARYTRSIRNWDGTEETCLLLAVRNDVAYVRYSDGQVQSLSYEWMWRNSRR